MKRIEGVVCSVVQLPAWGEHDLKEKWRKEGGRRKEEGEEEEKGREECLIYKGKPMICI